MNGNKTAKKKDWVGKNQGEKVQYDTHKMAAFSFILYDYHPIAIGKLIENIISQISQGNCSCALPKRKQTVIKRIKPG